jgi:aldose 1-epimerase
VTDFEQGRVLLEAGRARAIVDPRRGGRLLSLACAGRELLAQDNGEEGPIPRCGSFVLAPWVGELHSGRLVYRGEVHQLPANVGRHAVHGLVFNDPWAVESRTPRSLSLLRELTQPWPLGGYVRQDFRLQAERLTQVVTLTAGSRAMPASVGWHPWFRCDSPQTARIRVQAQGMLELDRELIPTGRVLELADEFDLRDAPLFGNRRLDVVYTGVASPVEFVQPGLHLVVEFDTAITSVVVYSTAGTVCIEPWSAWPDAVRMSQRGFPSGVTELEPGERLERSTRWAWELPANS